VRTILTAAAAALIATARAPTPISASRSSFALSVADLDASAKWYASAFDVKVAAHPPKENGNEVIVLQGRGLTVALIRSDAAVPFASLGPKPADAFAVHGFVKAGILVDDFSATMEALRAKNVRIAYGLFPERPDQKAYGILKDSAGNLIQIIAR
jgi:hypothetical protein